MAVKRPAKKARAPAGTRTVGETQRHGELLAELSEAGESVTLEVDGERVALTHLDKVLWPADAFARTPAYTRRDLVAYLLHVAPFMLPHMRDRPLTLIRMPSGVGGRRFVQFHWEQKLPPFVETISIWSEKNAVAEEFLLCNNLSTLLWLAHVGTLEFHVWHSRADPQPDVTAASTDFTSSASALQRSVLNFPDYIVFDIDPYIYSGREAKGDQPEYNAAAFEKGKAVAFRVKALLEGMGLDSRVKTSGRTGLHVLVPVVRTIDYDAARALAEAIARHLVREHPDEITIEWDTRKRAGKVFFDYTMNVRVKTLAAPYSVRAAPGAPVSMPLTWKELEKATPERYTIAEVPRLLAKRGDIWRDMLQAKQKLENLLAASPADRYGSGSRRSPHGPSRRRSG